MNAWGQKLGRWFTKGQTGLKTVAQGLAPPGQKASAVSGLMGSASKAAFISFSSPRWTGRSYEQLSREGFRKNVVVNRCVRILSESAASVPLQLFRGDKPIDKHPLLDLLKNPNPLQSGIELMAGFYAFLEIAGNSYLELVTGADGRPGELYLLRPERMRIVPGPNGWPARFEYKVGAKSHHFVVDAKTGQSPIMHLKTFNPDDDHYGLSSLEPSAFAVGIHNSAADWNKALLDNAARPSGALLFEPTDGTPANLSDEQFRRLKDELEDNYQGAINAGRPFLLEGGLKWQAMGLTPHDMEFIQSKNVSAREIALAFGVPPMILGIPGDNTFANYAEANRALWRLTLLPLLEKTAARLNTWLVPRFGPDLMLKINRDAIPALTFEREAEWNRVGVAQFLTVNEKRKALGFEPIKDGDKLASEFFLPPGGAPPNPFDKGGAKITQKGLVSPATKAGCVPLTVDGQGNVLFKVWVSSKDGKVRESHDKADGQVRLVNEKFDVGGAQLRRPQDPNGPPEETFNCRCEWHQKTFNQLNANQKIEAQKRILNNACDPTSEDIKAQALAEKVRVEMAFKDFLAGVDDPELRALALKLFENRNVSLFFPLKEFDGISLEGLKNFHDQISKRFVRKFFPEKVKENLRAFDAALDQIEEAMRRNNIDPGEGFVKEELFLATVVPANASGKVYIPGEKDLPLVTSITVEESSRTLKEMPHPKPETVGRIRQYISPANTAGYEMENVNPNDVDKLLEILNDSKTRHELGHTLIRSVNPEKLEELFGVAGKLVDEKKFKETRNWFRNNLSLRSSNDKINLKSSDKKTKQHKQIMFEAFAEAFAWFTSPSYPKDCKNRLKLNKSLPNSNVRQPCLPEEIEAIILEQLRTRGN